PAGRPGSAPRPAHQGPRPGPTAALGPPDRPRLTPTWRPPCGSSTTRDANLEPEREDRSRRPHGRAAADRAARSTDAAQLGGCCRTELIADGGRPRWSRHAPHQATATARRARAVRTQSKEAARGEGRADRVRVPGGVRQRAGGPPAVKGRHVTVPPGEVFGYLGPNGAGKTTTIR